MKFALTSLICLGITLSSSSQEKSGFISLQAGPSVPVGKYHVQELELPAGSFAIAGISTTLEGAWFFKPWLGIGGQAGLNYHPVDVSTLGYEIVLDNPEISDMYIRSEPYKNYSLYAGLYFERPVVQRLSFTAKALGGMLFSQTPYQLYKGDYYLIGENWYEKTSAGDFEGSFMAGAGFRYALKNCIGFTVNGEFTYNKVDFDFQTPDGNIRTDEKVISFVNVTAGIFLKL